MAPLASNFPLFQGTWRLIYHSQTKETLAAGLFNTQKIISGTLLRMQPAFVHSSLNFAVSKHTSKQLAQWATTDYSLFGKSEM